MRINRNNELFSRIFFLIFYLTAVLFIDLALLNYLFSICTIQITLRTIFIFCFFFFVLIYSFILFWFTHVVQTVKYIKHYVEEDLIINICKVFIVLSLLLCIFILIIIVYVKSCHQMSDIFYSKFLQVNIKKTYWSEQELYAICEKHIVMHRYEFSADEVLIFIKRAKNPENLISDIDKTWFTIVQNSKPYIVVNKYFYIEWACLIVMCFLSVLGHAPDMHG